MASHEALQLPDQISLFIKLVNGNKYYPISIIPTLGLMYFLPGGLEIEQGNTLISPHSKPATSGNAQGGPWPPLSLGQTPMLILFKLSSILSESVI